MAHDSVIGSHSVQQYGDIMQMRMRGPLVAADVSGMREMVRAVLDERGSCFVVADASDLSGIDADARRAMADWGRSHPETRASGVVVYGVNFVTRTLITLTINAVKLLGYREVELKFTSDEDESLAWVDGQRSPGLGTDDAAPAPTR